MGLEDFIDENGTVIEMGTAKDRVEQALEMLKQFYISQGVNQQIASEYARKMPAEELAGLRFNGLPKVNPDLEQVKDGFRRMIQEGIDPNAAAILLTDDNVRAKYTGQTLALLVRVTEERTRTAMKLYYQTLDRIQNPAAAAMMTVTEMARSYWG